MRIIGGKYKGRIFRPNKKFKARPTTDIAREGLFNVLMNRYDFSNHSVLDLFAGTGSISYEFISRGVKNAVLVEINFNHYRFIQEVIRNLNIENARIYRSDVFKFLRNCKEKFFFIFADPPFDLQNLGDLPDRVLEADLLHEEGIFILEHPAEHDFSKHPYYTETRYYGKVRFSFFQAQKMG